MPEYTPLGSEFQVNSTTTENQHFQSITGLTTGGFVITWASANQGICAQAYSVNGTALGSELLVSDSTLLPAVAALADGGFMISWVNSTSQPPGFNIEVRAQRYDAGGTAIGEMLETDIFMNGGAHLPSMAVLADGGIVISWSLFSGGVYDVYAQRFASNGAVVGTEFRVNSTSGNGNGDSSVAALQDGGFVVSWTSGGQHFTSAEIHAQRFAGDGTLVGTEFRVDSTTLTDQREPSVAALSDGGFVISWQSEQDGSGYGIYAQRYGASGSPAGSPFRVNSTTDSQQLYPSVIGLIEGGFVVSWQSYQQDGSQYGIYAQAYDGDGVATGGEFRVNTTTADHQERPAIAALAEGGFVVSWRSYFQDTSGYGIYAQRFSSDGTASLFTSGPDLVDFNLLSPEQIQSINEGREFYDALAGNDTVILPNVGIQLTNSVVWDPLRIFHGGANRDNITGGNGSDIIDGGDGSDIINGGSGDDVLIGSDGDDILIGGDGEDTFDFSTFSFSNFSSFNTVQSLHGGLHPAGGPIYLPSNPDLLRLPGRPDEYDITTTGTQVSIVHIETSILFTVANIERVTFNQPAQNNVEQTNLLEEMIRLSIDAYQPQAPLRNWHPLSALELGLLSSGTDNGLSFTMNDGWYSAVNPTSLFEAVADAIVSIGMINGVRTLSIAFRGTDDPTDVSDWLDFPAHYAKFKPLIEAIDAFILANGIQQVLVSGHSLGGAMVQEYMARHSGPMYVGLTIGSPGGDTANPNGSDSRIVNFMHTDDIVTRGVIANVRDGGEIYINSDVSLIPYFSVGEHSKPLYLSNYLILLEFAKDPQSPFSLSPLGINLALGQVYSGIDIQIAVGRAGSEVVNSNFQDNFVLAGAGNDRILWNNILPIGNRVVDGGVGTDAVVLFGNPLLWGRTAVGSHFDLSFATIKVGELWRVEKLIFTFSIFETSVSLSQSQESSSTKTSADVVDPLVPVVWLDGRQATVQTPNNGDASLIVSTSVDYVSLGDRDISVTGSGVGDVVMLGTGVQTVAGGGGGDLINGVGSGSASILQLFGQAGDDILIGGEGNDGLDGGDGADQLFGGAGSDTIVGGADADLLMGGLGSDALTGGQGNDVFRDTKAGLNDDIIADFGVDDSIVLSDATLDGFTFNLSGGVLTYTGGSLIFGAAITGHLVASAAIGGGVQLTLVSTDVRNDFNGDGRSDILWRNVDGQMSNWLGTATGGWLPNDTSAGATIPTSWRIAGTGDFNGDGHDDILWRNDNGLLSNWLGTASGGFTANDANAHIGVPTAWSVAGTGDFNGDGRDDILWRNTDGQMSSWLGTALGGWQVNDSNAAATVPPNWHIVSTGDFNGDGRDDILWRNDAGEVSNWLGTVSGGFTPNDANAFAGVPTNWAIAGTGDFNGDGRDDILWRNSNGQMSNWLGTASGGWLVNDGNAAATVPTDWQVHAIGDYNGDGRDDVLWRNVDGQLSNWLGIAAGGFIPNDSNAAVTVPVAWHVQPEDPLI